MTDNNDRSLSTKEQMHAITDTAITEDYTATHSRSDPDVVEVTHDDSGTTHTVSLDTAQCSCDDGVESICTHMMYVLLNMNDTVTEGQHRLAQSLMEYQEDVLAERDRVRSRAHALNVALTRYDGATAIEGENDRVTLSDVHAVMKNETR